MARYSPNVRASVVAAVFAGATVGQVAARYRVSPASVRRWCARARGAASLTAPGEASETASGEASETAPGEASAGGGHDDTGDHDWLAGQLSDRPRPGRPAIHDTAVQVVSAVLAVAGPRVSSRDYSTRRIAVSTGLSQAAVSRAMRDIGASVARCPEYQLTLLVCAFPVVVIGVQRLAAASGGVSDSGPGAVSAVSGMGRAVHAQQRAVAAVGAAFIAGGIEVWEHRFASDRGVLDLSQIKDLLAQAHVDTAIVLDPFGVLAPEAGVADAHVHGLQRVDTFAAFHRQAMELLAGCVQIPAALLNELATRVTRGLDGLVYAAWQDKNFITNDSKLNGQVGREAGHRGSGHWAVDRAETGAGSAGRGAADRAETGAGSAGRGAIDRGETGAGRAGHGGLEYDVPRSGLPMVPNTWLPRDNRSVTEQLALGLRQVIMDTGYAPGDELSPAELAADLSLPRAAIDAALRRMVDEDLLDGSHGDVRIPQITAEDVIDLYAARLSLGELLLKNLAGRQARHLLPVRVALRRLQAASSRAGADDHDSGAVADADLSFQQELARASGLDQTARTFESLTLRLRMYISILGVDYRPTAGRISHDDRAIFTALAAGDAKRAILAWRAKVDNAVRHMSARAKHAAFNTDLWQRLT